MKLPTLTTADWLNAEQLAGITIRTRPSGSMTATEYAGERGLNYGSAKFALKQMVDAGALDTGKFNHKGTITNWYLPKKKARRNGHLSDGAVLGRRAKKK